jgi:hypothetical protein
MSKTIDEPLTKLADAAFQQVVQKVIERARRCGTPLILWEDGCVKEVPPPPPDEAESRKRPQ